MTNALLRRRILVCDDETGVIEAYRRILSDLVEGASAQAEVTLDALAADLFGDEQTPAINGTGIDEIVYCRQGDEAVAVFGEAAGKGEPFAAVFVDVRMPPGFDGVEAARRMRALDPAINIVMVTGYSDHRPAEIAGAIGAQDRLFYLVKPFDADEVRQMATTLVHRWTSDMRAAAELTGRLQELEKVNRALQVSEASAHRAARRDPLTGLLNRKGLQEAFDAAMSEASKADGKLFFAYIDLDRFKMVNDVHGHAVGDLFICNVGDRIVRATGQDGFVARLGGDEFAVVITEGEELDSVLNRVLRVGDIPFAEAGSELPVSLSIGYCRCDVVGGGLSDAMRRADLALYSAKAAGRGTARGYDKSLDDEFLRSQVIACDLKAAIENSGLQLHYQPLMSADGCKVTGLEALLRWTHPEHGDVSPAVFISIAEQNNMMIELGDWVLRQAMRDIRSWPDIITSINLSAVQFSQPCFAEKVIQLARAADISPSLIEFEITETALCGNMFDFAQQVEKLCDAGFKLALDDFGSGYAGIGYLSQLRFNKLKIDQSFVSNLRIEPNAERIIRSLVGLGEAMGLTVTAEGVEEVFQHELLRAAGCDQMQGFLFHRPCSREDVKQLLDRQRSADRAA
ncbi:EAL domain-containing protein [Rhizobium sp. XQZ8]|uniref:putative bifunctional diguanylate cyclase/phosphodiesterase n=1 Tax=Rhizobium populisoli TaxID=2859785 RepID=UPI001CA51ECE|nr:EAL domain-containing protein [Rhizobium populisoli]MBW6425196.1 EAL domain-containing protein [Rhizobium populisoli]